MAGKGKSLGLKVGLLLGAFAAAPHAQYVDKEERSGPPSYADEPADVWHETPPELPRYPRDADLVAIDPSLVGSSKDVLIDLRSISAGADGVTRYTAVIRGSASASQVLFEGLRCKTREYKTFAYGTSDGRFRNARAPRWKRLRVDDPTFRRTLGEIYLCTELRKPVAVSTVVKRLSKGGWDGQYSERVKEIN